MRVQIDIKGRINRNESYREKNRGLTCVPKFVTHPKKCYIIQIYTYCYNYTPLYLLSTTFLFQGITRIYRSTLIKELMQL